MENEQKNKNSSVQNKAVLEKLSCSSTSNAIPVLIAKAVRFDKSEDGLMSCNTELTNPISFLDCGIPHCVSWENH